MHVSGDNEDWLSEDSFSSSRYLATILSVIICLFDIDICKDGVGSGEK